MRGEAVQVAVQLVRSALLLSSVLAVVSATFILHYAWEWESSLWPVVLLPVGWEKYNFDNLFGKYLLTWSSLIIRPPSTTISTRRATLTDTSISRDAELTRDSLWTSPRTTLGTTCLLSTTGWLDSSYISLQLNILSPQSHLYYPAYYPAYNRSI